MPRLGIWNSGKKGATYHYIDRMIAQWFGASGTGVFVHLYEGVHDQTGEPDSNTSSQGVTTIQDVLFLENRDRKYSKTVYELRGVYNVQDVDFDLRQFGFFLQNDTIFLEFHLNDMIAKLGRKLVSGDVLELPHMRDDAMLDGGPAANKYYVVEDVNRASDGYSPTWFPHILRVKCSPMTSAQEYQDILDQNVKNPFGLNSGNSLQDILSSIGREMNVNEAVVAQAQASVPARNFETRQFYVVPGQGGMDGPQNPWIFAGDGIPPDGAQAVEAQNGVWPENPTLGQYCLRTDYNPNALFQWTGTNWQLQELDYRQGQWSVAHRLLLGFINNTTQVTFEDGTTADERTPLHQAAKPRADF